MNLNNQQTNKNRHKQLRAIKKIIAINTALAIIASPAVLASKENSASNKVIEVKQTAQIEQTTPQSYHSYLDVDFPQGDQYILYKETKYGLKLIGLKNKTRQALQPGKYKGIFKYIEKGTYYLITKDITIEPKTISKIQIDDKDTSHEYQLKLDPQIDFVSFMQSDSKADRIIPYSTLAKELHTLKTNSEKIDININDGKGELWLKHPTEKWIEDHKTQRNTNNKETLDIELKFELNIDNLGSPQKGYEIETTTPSGYRLTTMTYNDSEYQPNIQFIETNSNNSNNISMSNKETQTNIASNSTWSEIKLKREPLLGQGTIKIETHKDIFPYELKQSQTQFITKSPYEIAEENTTQEYPTELKAEIYQITKENGQTKYTKIKNYDLKRKSKLILDKTKHYVARIYGQNQNKIYDYITAEIKDNKDILAAKMPKGTNIFMAKELKDKITNISVVQRKLGTTNYTFDPNGITHIVTNTKNTPIIELGILIGRDRYYLAHIGNQTLFPMRTTRIDTTSNTQIVAQKNQMSVSTDRLKMDQNFEIKAITRNKKLLQPNMKLKQETTQGIKEIKGQYDLSQGKLNLEKPLEEGKLKIQMHYPTENIHNPLHMETEKQTEKKTKRVVTSVSGDGTLVIKTVDDTNVSQNEQPILLKDIAHMKQILDLSQYRLIKNYGLETENDQFYMNMKTTENTIETAKYKVYDGSGHQRNITLQDRQGKLYLDFTKHNFKDTYTLVIDYLETKGQTLKQVQINIAMDK